MNAYMAHAMFNEQFLASATDRRWVVSHAKSLGYTPRSRQAPTAIVQFLAETSNGSSYTIDRGSKFTITVDGEESVNFINISDVQGNDDETVTIELK